MAHETERKTVKDVEERRGVRRTQTRTVERTSITYDDGSSEFNQRFSPWHEPPCEFCKEDSCYGDHS